jgi:integrase
LAPDDPVSHAIRSPYVLTVAGLALEFAILTAARSGEVLGALCSEIDLDAKVWTIPAERIKATDCRSG